MKLVIAQLSDIHIESGATPILVRGQAIANAIKTTLPDASLCLLAITGDTAFSGKRRQYELADSFIEGIRTSLQAETQSDIVVEVIPGNHDCDFDLEGDARPVLLSALSNRLHSLDPSGQSADELLRIQEEFFAFRCRLTQQHNNTASERFFWQRHIAVAGMQLTINCYNTACTSRLKEQPGEVLFPMSFEVQAIPSDIVITMFHHPYGWLEPSNARAFRNQVEQSSDIILTGHEHISGGYLKKTLGSVSPQYYVEAAALFANDGQSGFNVVSVDLDATEYEVTKFIWDQTLYRGRNSQPEPYVRARISGAAVLANTPAFAATLEEPGTGFTHPVAKDRLRLSDVYVYPDLLHTNPPNPKAGPVTIASGDAFAFFREHDKVLVYGEEECGKSGLARILYRDLQRLGLAPLIINAADFKGHRPREIRYTIRRTIENQYGTAATDEFLQQPFSTKVLIIDDWNLIRFNSTGQSAIVSSLSQQFSKLVICTTDLVQIMELAASSQSSNPFIGFEHCCIRELGYRLRGQLIEKWHAAGREYTIDAAELRHSVAVSERKINALIHQNLLPSYPVIILTLLQADDTDIANSNAGSYGHIYEALLTKKLGEGSSKATDIGTKYTYISYIAYTLFSDDKTTFSLYEFGQMHMSYCKRFDSVLDRDTILRELIRAHIFVNDCGVLRFKYSYCLYYFVARYFKENIADEPVLRKEIEAIADRVSSEEYANIIIFFIYLTNDRAIIEHILANARQIYREFEPSDLQEDVGFVNKLIKGTLPKLELPVGDVDKHREEFRERQDRDESASYKSSLQNWGRVKYEDAPSNLLKINIALKHLRILGQVLRNFPGVLRGDVKLELAKESYLLGLRVLRSLLESAGANIEELRQYYEYIIKEQKALEGDEYSGDASEGVEFATDQRLINILHGVAYGLIRKISYSIGHEDLQLTYKRVRDALGGDKPSIRLTDITIQLDHFRHPSEADLKELAVMFQRNPFAYGLLRQVVGDYLYADCTNQQRLQTFAGIMKIDIKGPGYLINKRVKLLPPEKKGV